MRVLSMVFCFVSIISLSACAAKKPKGTFVSTKCNMVCSNTECNQVCTKVEGNLK